MRPKKLPIRVPSLADGRQDPRRNIDPFADVQLEKVFKELSFIRILLDDVVFESTNPYIQRLHDSKQLYGFFLEYSFPCLDVVSKTLKMPVRIPEKDVTSTKIEFKHKKVVMLNMHEDQIDHWQKARFTIHLLVQTSVNRKRTTRPLAQCSIPLYELLVPPYSICRDFQFHGPEFEATSLIRIDLGTRVLSLMEKLEALRVDRSLENTFVVTARHREPAGRRTRSRSSSRCRDHSAARGEDDQEPRTIRRPLSVASSSNSAPVTPPPIALPPLKTSRDPPKQNHLLVPPMRHRMPSASSMGSDSVFVRPRAEETRRPAVHEVEQEPLERITKRVRNSYGASTVGNVVEEVSRGGKYYIQLTVHEATGLPPVEEIGQLVAPSTFISVLGREGDLRSPVIPYSREPRWQFTARFAISSERRNLIVKVHHHGIGGDSPLGIVSIPLPVAFSRNAIYEMADVSRSPSRLTNEVPMLKISIESTRNLDDHEENKSYMASTQAMQISPIPYRPPPRIDSPLIMESSEVIQGRMHRCMAELETMMNIIKR